MIQNYTLGRGKIYFSRFRPNSQIPTGFRYIGNTPEFSLTIESENLDHFSSDQGIREKDDSVPLEVTRTGSLITDHIDPENVALFFFGSKETLTVTGSTGLTETFDDIQQGQFYQVGVTNSNLPGVQGIDPITFEVDGADAGDDYILHADIGMIEIVVGGGITNGSTLTITYDVRGHTRARVLSGSAPVEGALKFVAHNPKGENFDYHMPWIKVTPNGDYALKGDEWQQIPFNLEALKPASGGEAIYMNGRPVYA